MILVDTSVWIGHLRSADAELRSRLEAGEVLAHPVVIGEIALGRTGRHPVLHRELALLPHAQVATDAEVLSLVERHHLAGSGIGWVDAHLVASSLITRGARLWTRDRRLTAVAARLDVTHAVA